MISKITGKLIYKSLSKIIIETLGIGFEILIPSRLYEKLPELNSNYSCDTYLHVREDEITLIGFINQKEKELFLKIISVSGVSIRIALGIFSIYSSEELSNIIVKENAEMLRRVPGVGNKLSERIILELKDKIKEESILKDEIIYSNSKIIEVKEALKSLGYTNNEIQKILSHIDVQFIEKANIEDILKAALRGA
jgi:Holliday junction DNA helicase RuvA